VKFPKKTLRDIPLDNRTVLVRADYNVPLNADGTIADDYRLTQSLPTLKYLLTRGCKVVVCSHLGRPDGAVKPSLSLEPIATRLGELLDHHVAFVPASVGDRVIQAVKHAPPSRVLLLENLRFHAGEEANDKDFAQLLAKDSQAEYFIQDGFGVVHRAHASTDAITHFLPSVGGLLLEREFCTITDALDKPKKPFVAILGGAKISDKIKVIERFVKLADTIIIGGAMANTFLKYHGLSIGKSVHEDGLDEIIKSIYDQAAKKLTKDQTTDDFIILPTDVAVAPKLEPTERRNVVTATQVHPDEMIADIGPDTIDRAVAIIQEAGTVIWNGTMGFAEIDQFAIGSARVALQLAQQPDTTSIIGGGDTADFVLHWDAKKGGSFTHVSTGGGASLDLMAGEPMPGIESLMNA
jgi:3-phosphoglycerate kinase